MSDLRRTVFVVKHDNWPEAWYVHNHHSGESNFLFYKQPELTQYTFSRKRSAVITTRDNLKILCYYSIPVEHDLGNGKTTRPLSMLLIVHGGPWGTRDTWEFDRIPQMFSNRGLVTLQCNFRGSAGFGKTFSAAGNGEFGRKMQYDLIDAVKWAIEMKIADEGRIAIYGWSYGGYSALFGLTMTPTIFACGVNIIGPSNLTTYVQARLNMAGWIPSNLLMKMGALPNSTSGRAFLDSRSPMLFADKIIKPLLIIHGGIDHYIELDETVHLYRAMCERSVPFTFAYFPDDGHRLSIANQRYTFAASDHFLKKCLPDDYRAIEPLTQIIQEYTSASVYKFDGKTASFTVVSKNKTKTNLPCNLSMHAALKALN